MLSESERDMEVDTTDLLVSVAEVIMKGDVQVIPTAYK